MKKFFLAVAVMLICSSIVVLAQVDKTTMDASGATCGNGVREPYEPCDKTSNASDRDMCPAIGKILKIAMVCDPRPTECGCQPRRFIVCGDKHTRGNEMCDSPDTDYCPQVGALLGAKLACDTKTCLCTAANDVVFTQVTHVNTTNLTESLCGNHQVDDSEECDPPGRLCTFGRVVGVCSEKCKCKEVESDTANPQASVAPQAPAQSSSNTSNTTTPAQETVSEPKQGVTDSAAATSSDENPPEQQGLSDATYTLLLIVFVIVFIVGLSIGSFFLYKHSQVGGFDEQLSDQEKKE